MQNPPIADIEDDIKDIEDKEALCDIDFLAKFGVDYEKEKAIAMKAHLKKHFKRAFDGEIDTADPDLGNFSKRFCVGAKKNRYHVSLLHYTDKTSDFITKFERSMDTIYLKPLKCASVTWVTPTSVAAISVVHIEWVVDFKQTEFMSVYKQKIIRALFCNMKVGSA